MNNLIKKAAKAFRTVNYCLASAPIYLHETNRKK